MFIRLEFVRIFLPDFKIKEWLKEVLAKDFTIIFISVCIIGILNQFNTCPLFMHILITTVLSLCLTLPLIYFGGITDSERKFIKTQLKKIKKNI